MSIALHDGDQRLSGHLARHARRTTSIYEKYDACTTDVGGSALNEQAKKKG